MALDRNAKYPGRYDAPTPEQPQGAFKNRTSSTSNDGSYLERDWLNDWSGFMSSLLAKVGFTPNNQVDEVGASQYFEAMELGRPVENRFKGNQNWNVAGSTGDPVPGGTPTTYTVGAQVVAGVEVITTNAEQVTYVAGVLNSGNNTGILRRRYAKDSAGLITKTSQYAGIKLADGSQLPALVDDLVTNGVRITEDGSDVVVDVDLSVVTTGFRFFGMSDERGAWADINDEDSKGFRNLSVNNLFYIQDQKPTGTTGGANIAASYQTRTLNTEIISNIKGASLLSNKITLPPGEYFIEATCPAYRVNRHRIALYNVTSASYDVFGNSGYTDQFTTAGVVAYATLSAQISVSVVTEFELRHYTEALEGTTVGLGVDVSDGNPEIYSEIKIWKV